jgi:transposase
VPVAGKTDKLDAQGLATLLYLGKLPYVWIPPADLRDQRELPRTRMTFAKHRTMVKNRIRSTLAKYALSLDTASDIFAPKWRSDLEATLLRFPEETGRCALQQLQILDALNQHIRQLEDRIQACIETTPTIQLVQSVPGPAKVLAIVIDREVGSIERFSAAKHFTSDCGLVPKLSASAGRAHYGRMVKQCNTYLKWAFIACPGRSGQGGGQRHRRPPPCRQLAGQVRGPPLRAHPPAQGPFRRRRCLRSLSSGVDVLGSQEE